GKAADLLRKQASVYDGERLGNRVMNFFGDLIGRDLSRERLGFRALKGLIDAEDQSEARELQMGLARDVLHVKLASGFDPAGIGLLRRIAERTKEGYFFKDDLGHQLALAAGASLYKEKKAKADAARAAAAKRRREEKIEERRRPIDALRTREREARSVYDDRTLENIDGLIAARDAERAGLLAAKRSFAVKGSTDVAFAVLGAQTLFARARKLLSEAAGPNANAREKDLKLEWEELRAAADSIKKNLGSFFNLSTMTKETKDQMNASDTARARAFVALLDKLIGIGDIGKPAQAALQTVLKSAEDLFQAKDGGGLTETAKAALLLDMEDHAIDCDEVLGRMMSGEKAGAANDLATETVSGIAGLTAKSDSVRNALASVNGVQALREARLRRAAAGGGDAGRRAAGSSKLALIVYALHAALNRPIGENWKIYAKTIEKLRANNKEILDRFNLRTMTDDCKDTSDENDTMRRDDFMRRIQDVTRAKDAADCRRAAESLIEYMRDNSMTALADAALIEDAVPLTKGKLDKLTEGIVGSGNLDVKNDMKGTYRKTLKKKMQLTADETDKRTGAQLIKDARLARKDADIEDDEKGMELALTLAAMRKLAVDANSTGATGSDDAWESYKAAFGSLASGLPDVKNLLAITAGGADFLSLPDVKAVNDNFNAFLSFVVNADNRVDFYSGVKDIKDFFERYRILDRTDAVIAADAHLTAAERRRDLTEALGAKGTMSEAKGKVQKSKQNSGIRLLDKVRDEMERDYDRLSAQTGRLKLDAYAGESDAELLFTARGERNTKYGIEGDPKEGATLALNVLGIQTLARHIKDKSTDYAWKPDAAKAAFKKLRLNLQRVFNLEAMTSDAEDLQEGSHVQRLRRDYRALLDAFEDCTTQEEIRKAAEDIYFFALANRLPGRAEAAIAIKDADETFDKKLSKAVCAKTESENNLLQLVRIDLETGYSQTMGKDPLVVTDNPSSLLSADMRENLGAVTKIVVLGVFRTILPPVSFNKFLEALQNPQSEAYALSAERIGIALADAAFEKKGAGGATGKHYRPLAKGEATGVATERSLALARHFINEFSDEIKQLKKPAKQWLKENADTHQSDFSIRQSLLREDLGKEAAAAHKALMVGEMVENLTERVTKDSALHISGHAGGTIGASATVTAVKGNVDLGLTLENDLSIEHG
ncbi:MAG: hypothetical protein LBP73_11550, partial [Clostridiales Family XIII bacterium]|nr:hypothetical protein [Clostridiales Family XIII bacterium]